jgi:hypothetical protein
MEEMLSLDLPKFPRKIDFLLELSNINTKVPRNISEFERIVGYKKPQPDFRNFSVDIR